MRRPLVAVATDTIAFAGTDWFATQRQYVAAISGAAGLTPLLVPNLGEALDHAAVLDAVDGLLLTGSTSNVFPELYGAVADEATGPYDRARDATTFPLLRIALEAGLPLFAICRGMQELNVARGGTLQGEIQLPAGRFDHRAPPLPDRAARFGPRHGVQPRPASDFAGIVGADPIMVNSLHRQAIAVAGDGVVADATAEDGIVEAVSVRGASGFVVGVQWHPEFAAESEPVSARLFAAFGDAVRSHARRRAVIQR